MKKKVLEEKAQRLANELLTLMETKLKAKATFDKENDAITVDIESGEETGLLIGRHGDTLNSIQTILGMMIKNETGEWKHILVNVGDWREKQEDYLKTLAQETATRAKETGEPQPLYNLTPSQRRVVHMTLSEDPEVETESVGEDAERYLVVKPKK